MSYDQVLTAARLAPLSIPEFDSIAEAAARDRAALVAETDDHGARARR